MIGCHIPLATLPVATVSCLGSTITADDLPARLVGMDAPQHQVFVDASDDEKLTFLLQQCSLLQRKKKLLDANITFAQILRLFRDNKAEELQRVLQRAGLSSTEVSAVLGALAVIEQSASDPLGVGEDFLKPQMPTPKKPAPAAAPEGGRDTKGKKFLSKGARKQSKGGARRAPAAAAPGGLPKREAARKPAAAAAAAASPDGASSRRSSLESDFAQLLKSTAASLAQSQQRPAAHKALPLQSLDKLRDDKEATEDASGGFFGRLVARFTPAKSQKEGGGVSREGGATPPSGSAEAPASAARADRDRRSSAAASLQSSDASESDLWDEEKENAAENGSIAHSGGSADEGSAEDDLDDEEEEKDNVGASAAAAGAFQSVGVYDDSAAAPSPPAAAPSPPAAAPLGQEEEAAGGDVDGLDRARTTSTLGSFAASGPQAEDLGRFGRGGGGHRQIGGGGYGQVGGGGRQGSLDDGWMQDEKADLSAAIAASLVESEGKGGGQEDTPPPEAADPLEYLHRMRFRSRRDAEPAAPVPGAARAGSSAQASDAGGDDGMYTDFSPLAPDLSPPSPPEEAYADGLQTIASAVPLQFFASAPAAAAQGAHSGPGGVQGGAEVRRLSSRALGSAPPMHPLMSTAKAYVEHDTALRMAHTRFFGGGSDPTAPPSSTPWGRKQSSADEPLSPGSSHDFGPEDDVHFSAYAPSAIAQGGVAPLDVWAFLKAQEAAVREAASAKGATRRGDSLKALGIRRGELVTIDLRVPRGVFMLGEEGEEGGGAVRRLTWVGYKPLSARWWIKARRGATIGAHAAHALIMVGVRVLRLDLTLTVVSSKGAASAAAFAAASIVRARQAEAEMGSLMPPSQRDMWLAAVRETGAQGRFVLPAFGDGSKPKMVQVDDGSVSSAQAVGSNGQTAQRGSGAFDTVTSSGPVECSWLKTRLSLVDASLVEISWDDIELGAPLGAGAHGTARSATIKGASAKVLCGLPEMSRALGGASAWSGISAVVKQPTLDPLSGNDDAVRAFKHEMAVTAFTGQHPNIVTQLGGCTEDGAEHLAMVLEHCAGGSLDSVLSGRGHSAYSGPSAAAKLRWCRDVASGLANMHSAGVLHCDVASRNVLLASDGTAKVADMGLARHLGIAPAVQLDSYGPFQCMAPEMLQSPAVYSRAADVYAFGTFVYEVFASDAASGSLARPWQGLAATDVMACMRERAGARLCLDPSAHRCSAAVAELQRRCCSFAFSTSDTPPQPDAAGVPHTGEVDALWGGLQLPTGSSAPSDDAPRVSCGGVPYHVALQGSASDKYVRPSMSTVVLALDGALGDIQRSANEAAFGGLHK